MQPLRKLFFVTLATLALGFAFSTSQVAYAQEDVPPAEDDVVINEFVVNPAAGKEYIELLVTKPGGVNMQGWTISDVSSRTAAAGAGGSEGDFILPASAPYLANVPQGTFVVLVLTTPAANTNTLTEDTSTTDGNRRLVLFTTTAGVTVAPTIDNAASDNIQVYAGTRATGTLIDQTLAGTNTSLVAGATWGDNSTATTTDNINGGTSIPSNSAIRFVPTADTLAAYQDNDTGARFVRDAASYGTPGAPNTGVPGDASIFSGGGAPLIISEFRLQGPTGTCDEFVEIYNTSEEPYTVQSLNAGSTGFSVVSSNGPTVLFTIPNGDTIPARGHYLGTNDGTLCTGGGAYSSGTYPAGNNTTATATGDRVFVSGDTPLNAGIALFNNSSAGGFTDTNRLDAVGPTSETNAIFKEGTGYPPLDASAQVNFQPNYSIYRDLRSGLPQDTQDNDADFDTVNPNGTELCAPTANFSCVRLGAPGPENLSSPVQRNADIKASLIDPNCTGMAVNPVLPSACRFERRTAAGSSPAALGTLSIRRRFTNSTGAPVTRLRFRIVNITTFPEGGNNGFADLRAISSSTVTAYCQSESGIPHQCTDNPSPTTDIEGTTLETDQYGQTNGGGFNSTLTLPNQLADGASINLQFTLGVETNGFFRFFVNVEALTGTPALQSPAATKAQATGKARASKLKK
ncbi:MAG TPA: hypothetical protein VIQ24_13800 [Pyrinomonadaceae bacterium]